MSDDQDENGKVISLAKARKARARAAKDAQAAQNRIRNGRTKADKASQKATEEKRGRFLDSLRLLSPSGLTPTKKEDDQS